MALPVVHGRLYRVGVLVGVERASDAVDVSSGNSQFRSFPLSATKLRQLSADLGFRVLPRRRVLEPYRLPFPVKASVGKLLPSVSRSAGGLGSRSFGLRRLFLVQPHRRCGRVADEECLGVYGERHPGVTAGIVLFRDRHGPPDALGPNRYHGMGCIAYHFDRNPYHPILLLQKPRYLIIIYAAPAADR